MFKKTFIYFSLFLSFFYITDSISQTSQPQSKDTSILNASYDISREFYKEYNAAFIKYWKNKSGQNVIINQSHGGSSKQARSVIDGLEADVVTMNQSTDIDAISNIGKLIPNNWKTRLPHNSSPYASTILFLVRKGNPKQIKDWNDLSREGVSVIIPNPKTSGNGRYSYLAAWTYALKKNNNDENKAKEFVAKIFKNVPVLDTGGRGATTTFTQRGIGDVLLTFEAEIFLTLKEVGKEGFDIVIPSLSIQADAPVSIVDKVVDKKGTRAVAEAYLDYLFSNEGQEIAAKNYFRPSAPAVLQKYAQQFPKIQLFGVEEIFGSWEKAQNIHFKDGGVFDQIYQNK